MASHRLMKKMCTSQSDKGSWCRQSEFVQGFQVQDQHSEAALVTIHGHCLHPWARLTEFWLAGLTLTLIFLITYLILIQKC